MRTSATNRKIRILLTAINSSTLIPRPEFQRRLVWSNKDKLAFIQTVLEGYPFPEIYIAAGNVNPETGEGTEMLVDGQQRITTLFQYFKGSPDLVLTKDIPPYAALSQETKLAFLEYETVVRDLGRLTIVEIKRIFERINSANYALNAMEIHNARYAGAFKSFAEALSQNSFFEQHGVFSLADIRRMQDLRFALILTATVMSTYFNRDEVLEPYLERYNDEFEQGPDLDKQFHAAFNFINDCHFENRSRAFKRADLFTLIAEYIRAAFKRGISLDCIRVSSGLKAFYALVDGESMPVSVTTSFLEPRIAKELYYKAALQATNDRGNRVIRGEIIQAILDPSYVPQIQLATLTQSSQSDTNASSKSVIPPTTDSGIALLKLIEEDEGGANERGITEILDSIAPGKTFFLPSLRASGAALSMQTLLFRQGIEELVSKGWLYPPIEGDNFRTYGFRSFETSIVFAA